MNDSTTLDIPFLEAAQVLDPMKRNYLSLQSGNHTYCQE